MRSGRDEQTSRIGASRLCSPRYWTSRRNVSSAQCRSSKNTSIGPPGRASPAGDGPPSAISSGRASTSSSPIAPARRATTRLASSTSASRASSFSRAVVAAVLVLDPGERLQHDREREVRDALAVRDAPPSRTAARSLTTVASSCARRDLPAPASPSTVATRHERDSSASRTTRAALPARANGRRSATRAGASSPGASGAMSTTRNATPAGLALQLERFELLDGDRIPDEPVRRRADHDLTRLRALLEPRGDVDHVARRECAAGRAVAGDDLARVDPGAGVRARARSRATSSSLTTASAARASTAAATALSASSSCSTGRPKTATSASPANFSSVPAVTGDDGRDLAEVARQDSPHRLGIEPLAERRRARHVDEEDGDVSAGSRPATARPPATCRRRGGCRTPGRTSRRPGRCGRTRGRTSFECRSGRPPPHKRRRTPALATSSRRVPIRTRGPCPAERLAAVHGEHHAGEDDLGRTRATARTGT